MLVIRIYYLAKLSDRDNPWLCGYVEDMLFALAASNSNMGAKTADIYTPDVYIAYHKLSAELTPL